MSPAPITRLTPHIHDITIENLKVSGAKVAMDVEGLPEAPIQGLHLKNVEINSAKGAKLFYADIVAEHLVIKPQSGPPIMTGAGVKGSLK